jgi:hypothetical protein
MLALALQLGAEPESYTDHSHAVQVLIRKTLATFADADAEAIDIAIDGCSAPRIWIEPLRDGEELRSSSHTSPPAESTKVCDAPQARLCRL